MIENPVGFLVRLWVFILVCMLASMWFGYTIGRKSTTQISERQTVAERANTSIHVSFPLVLPRNAETKKDAIQFFAYDPNDNLTKTASNVGCQLSLDGGDPVEVIDIPTEVEFSTGSYWKFGLTQAETNGDNGTIICRGIGMLDVRLVIHFV